MRAGLTELQLASRAHTARSVVARIESRVASPSWETLDPLLGVAGFSLDASIRPLAVKRSHMLDDVPNDASAVAPLDPERIIGTLARQDVTHMLISAVAAHGVDSRRTGIRLSARTLAPLAWRSRATSPRREPSSRSWRSRAPAADAAWWSTSERLTPVVILSEARLSS